MSLPNRDIIDNIIERGPGYAVLKISKVDLKIIKSLILRSFQRKISSTCSNPLIKELCTTDLEEYHEHITDREHKILWDKSSRMLSEEEINKFKDLDFYQQLASCYGRLDITDEERAGRCNIYWRIVRPNKPVDIGPIHADYMFWELSGVKIPEEKKRIKVWIPVYCEPGISGLYLIPHSHKWQLEYYSELRDGKLKPVLGLHESDIEDELEIFDSTPGHALMFHDRLLHGGFHKGEKTRLSIELTALVDK